ncbi:MAG TPA: tRNA dihydrouridine(20/20a) synthase DusA, partial [Rhodospirillum rubrum]|nr:tRNA dihydrouridine(20/20a) synthase DusA [Rhodospirillum rubrum]
MITAQALLHADPGRFLDHHPDEHPLALQLGGSDPRALAEATR